MRKIAPKYRALRKLMIRLKLIIRIYFITVSKAGVRLNPTIKICKETLQNVVNSFHPKLGKGYSVIRKMAVRNYKLILILIPLLVSIITIYNFKILIYGPNLVKNYTLYIHDEDKFDRVVSMLQENGCVKGIENFKRLAWFMNYPSYIKPGAYKLEQGWSISKLINVLKTGAQTPVMVTFNSIRTCEELAGKLAKQLQSDSISFLSIFKNDSSTQRLGFKPETLPALFIPNSYSFYWTTTPAGFLTRMKREYDLFWNEKRKQKAKEAGLTPDQVATLASIVQEESNKNDEKPMIAGVYLNRLHSNWPLQADPTIRFALGDFTIRRILTAQLSVESPYNTYKNAGLPPGPINIPEIASLESVLNHTVHEYYYFCAKEDFSGYHNFAKTLSEHSRNARKYQEALNKMKVFK